MACSPEILAAAGGDPTDTVAIQDAFFEQAIHSSEVDDRRAHPRSGLLMDKLEDAAHTAYRKSQGVSGEELEAIINAPSPLAAAIPTTPRKKLKFLTEDEDIL
jgi:hypothetical protein